ncbi:crotonase/enoyl-CoA hydratase family protein [Actinocorallia sp. A-T 12471]|uniref:crotonase/enoyl-CoA hydratase family protein n=1 Tax=Actinocorallia sp. A-T 12471 TaxID=3089813 RepID=UPI0029CD70C1|nr:crotonase/enoyl-CoA hydratase family protein [Actinocorallia sp. A-T 12471]MDX6741469.1 crotonase/enoyl-CoA hydratase family protein [Actinocorallia sp. A-T 12471]
MESKVLVDRDEHVLVLTINRPRVRNAVDADVCALIGTALEEAEHDSEVRCVVLTGAGEASFSSGADLKAIARGERLVPEGMEQWSFAGFVRHFTSKPTIAAVNGTALGGGMELALACDLVVAVESAVFGLPEVKRGLVAAAGGAFRITRALPPKIAMELLMTGAPLTASDAAAWGLVNHVVPDGTALAKAMEIARVISANAPLAVQATKRIAYGAREGAPAGEDTLWDLSDAEVSGVYASEDAQEGPRAFAEKRAPVWRAR